jgi:hypothetical protein
MFVERDTGPQDYFAVPLARACAIFQGAFRDLEGLDRTVRGPSMSWDGGKVMVRVATLPTGKVFVLEFLQHRDPRLVGVPFFAVYDDSAIWMSQLKPYGESDSPFWCVQGKTRPEPEIARCN